MTKRQSAALTAVVGKEGFEGAHMQGGVIGGRTGALPRRP